jgi:hypothetical protein
MVGSRSQRRHAMAETLTIIGSPGLAVVVPRFSDVPPAMD